METALGSRLPTFKLGDDYTTALGPDNKETHVVEVLCQRSWCKGVFVVDIKLWWRKNIWERKKENGEVSKNFIYDPDLRTRPCPYCHNWHKLPKRPKRLRTRK